MKALSSVVCLTKCQLAINSIGRLTNSELEEVKGIHSTPVEATRLWVPNLLNVSYLCKRRSRSLKCVL